MTIVQSTLLSDAKSNLQLVISSNEMPEDALKRESLTQSRGVGRRRTSGRENNRSVSERSQSMDYAYTVETPSPPVLANADNCFFKFRFSSSTAPPSRRSSSARPGAPSSALSSPSMHSLPSHVKEMEELTAELAKERSAKLPLPVKRQHSRLSWNRFLKRCLRRCAVQQCPSFSPFTSLAGEQNGCQGTYEAGGDGRRAQRTPAREGGTMQCPLRD